MRQYLIQYLFLLVSIGAMQSCKKYLAAKPDESLALPHTLSDLHLMLDNYTTFNMNYTAMGEIASDNLYLSDANWGSSNTNEQSYYIWQPYDNNVGDYEIPNTKITTANLILESLGSIKLNSSGEVIQANNIEGSALFFRALAYWALSQNFCTGFHKNTASKDLGLPIRLSSRVLGKFPRSTVERTYQQIIDDLKRSIPLLPDIADVKYHVGKAAAYGLLSRTYLAMQDYDKSGAYADSCLQLYSYLMNYNDDPDITASSKTAPFAQRNIEVIFDAQSKTTRALTRTRASVDTTLFSLYEANDLRKTLFFGANTSGITYYFKGNYTGLTSAAMFCGIATDEMLITRSECEVRSNNLKQGLKDLNTLLATRWIKGTFEPVNISDKDSLLKLILIERRKELVFRGLRWTDLRRLNEEPKYQVTLKRIVGDVKYTLPPNSERYVFQFPKQSINISGIEQNP